MGCSAPAYLLPGSQPFSAKQCGKWGSAQLIAGWATIGTHGATRHAQAARTHHTGGCCGCQQPPLFILGAAAANKTINVARFNSLLPVVAAWTPHEALHMPQSRQTKATACTLPYDDLAPSACTHLV